MSDTMLAGATACLPSGLVLMPSAFGVFAEGSLRSLLYVILIDSLDEGRGEDHQAELLTAIRQCLLEDNLPFHVFIAS